MRKLCAFLILITTLFVGREIFQLKSSFIVDIFKDIYSGVIALFIYMGVYKFLGYFNKNK